MLKIIVILLILGLLTGCSDPTVYETLGDVIHVSATRPQPGQIMLEFPQQAAIMTASGGDMLYTCGDYTISLQTLEGGDLASTVRTLCGFDMEKLTVMETNCEGHVRYEWVWTSAGETGDVICRAAVLDDGNYHYCLCVQAEAEKAGKLSQAWNQLFCSFCMEH